MVGSRSLCISDAQTQTPFYGPTPREPGKLSARREAWISPQNCLPLYVLAQRHRVPSLGEASKALLSRSLLDKLRAEPDHVWQLLDELPRVWVVLG